MAAEGSTGFSRDELLHGLPARRASTLLFAIESRTALLVARDRRAMATFETEATSASKEQAFLAALGAGRTPPIQPTIQDLDRHARDWADLLPPDVEGRAALIARLAEKYTLPAQAIEIREVFGVSDPEVVAAYERQTRTALAAHAAARLSLAERWRWRRSHIAQRLEALPPFWLAFALTLTETVGGGILALPIAFAGLGPLAASVLLLALGAVNVLTVAALVEAITRNGNMRYGSTYFGRLVGDYLGRPGRFVLTPALFLLDGVGFVAALVGFGSTLAGSTGLPVGAWAAVLFAINAIFLWRGSFDATVASALTIGAVNIVLIVAISLLAFGYGWAHQAGVAAPAGGSTVFDASVLELVFGVALLAYFGHTSAGNSAKVVLARDPSGRSLLWGNVAAMISAMALYLFAVVAIEFAIPADELVGYEGTAITPLAASVGPIVNVLGSAYVVLAIGLGSIYLSLSLYNQMTELLPAAASRGSDLRARVASFLPRAAPIAIVFVVVEALIALDLISFTEPLSLVGTLTLPLLGGIFPMLMLVAARRKGDRVPGRVLGLLGNPVVVAVTIGLYFAAVMSYGLWIWSGPLERAAALAVAATIAAVLVLTWRQGAYRLRTVVELRREPGQPDRAILAVTVAGHRFETDITIIGPWGTRRERAAAVTIADPRGLRTATIALPAEPTPELRVWAHAVTPEGDSTAIPARITVGEGDGARRFDVPPGDGQVIIAAPSQMVGLELL